MVTQGIKGSGRNLINRFENGLAGDVKTNFPDNWNEDYVIRSFLNCARVFFHMKRFRLPGDLLRIRWHHYRLTSDADQVIADVALLFNISFHDGSVLEGSSFIMARVKDRDKNTFSALRKDQLKRMNSLAPRSHLILFDYDPIAGMAFPSVPEQVGGASPYSWDNWLPFSHAVAVPAPTALALGSKTTGLYKTAIPFSYLLCFRLFYGLDLEFGQAAVEISRGQRPEKGVVRDLCCVSVSHRGDAPSEKFEINRDLYREIVQFPDQYR